LNRAVSQKLLLTAGFSGVLFVSAFVVLGVLAPDYDSLRQTISSIEFTSLGTAQRANFFIFGLLLCSFAIALRRELAGGRGALLIPLFQALSGIGVIGDAIFIYEPLHTACDLVAFNSAMMVLFLFAWRFRLEPDWKGWTSFSIAAALAMMGFLAAFGFANHLGGPAGLFEKLATCTRTVWSALLTGRLLAGRRLGRI
jgi:Protein of unknown function (DUF998)